LKKWKCTVETETFAKYAMEVRPVLAAVEAGDSPDLQGVSREFGGSIEYLLCTLFSLEEATAKYDSDGVVFDSVALQPPRCLVLTGPVWVGHGGQWEVPGQIACRFSQGPEPSLESLEIRIGNAAMKTLADHARRSITKTSNPREWLIVFEVDSGESTG